jgi:hypothetical protein
MKHGYSKNGEVPVAILTNIGYAMVLVLGTDPEILLSGVKVVYHISLY